MGQHGSNLIQEPRRASNQVRRRIAIDYGLGANSIVAELLELICLTEESNQRSTTSGSFLSRRANSERTPEWVLAIVPVRSRMKA